MTLIPVGLYLERCRRDGLQESEIQIPIYREVLCNFVIGDTVRIAMMRNLADAYWRSGKFWDSFLLTVKANQHRSQMHHLVGGTSDDSYIVDNAGDTITENSSEGTDSVQASVSYTLSSNVENLTLTGAGTVNATGNDLSNVLTGNTAANSFAGGIGADTLDGGAGADTLIGDDARNAPKLVLPDNSNVFALKTKCSLSIHFTEVSYHYLQQISA